METRQSQHEDETKKNLVKEVPVNDLSMEDLSLDVKNLSLYIKRLSEDIKDLSEDIEDPCRYMHMYSVIMILCMFLLSLSIGVIQYIVEYNNSSCRLETQYLD